MTRMHWPLRFSLKIALWAASTFAVLSLIALAIVTLAPHGETGFIHYLVWAYVSLPTMILFRLSEETLLSGVPNTYSLLVVADNAFLAGIAGFLFTGLFRFVRDLKHAA
jgi:hypothetical protein